MKEGEAESCAAQLDWIYRVVSREGEDFPATLDYRVDRISVTIKMGSSLEQMLVDGVKFRPKATLGMRELWERSCAQESVIV